MLSGVHTVASVDGKTRKGDTVTYTAEARNSGNTCLRGVEINDLLLGAEFDCKTGAKKADGALSDFWQGRSHLTVYEGPR